MHMTRASRLLEQLAPDETHHLHANHRSGIRCFDCGRLLSHVHALPAVRTCPNAECKSRYHISRSFHHGVGVRKV